MQQLSAVFAEYHLSVAAENLIEGLKFGVDVILLAGKILKRNWIRKIVRPAFFIYIKAYSYDAGFNVLSVKDILYQDSADLLVADPDVVGPLYPRFYAVGLKIPDKGDGSYMGNQDAVAGGKEAGPENDSKGKVAPRGRIPGVEALSTARRLTFCR